MTRVEKTLCHLLEEGKKNNFIIIDTRCLPAILRVAILYKKIYIIFTLL